MADMKKMAKHTPGPWRVKDSHPNKACFYIDRVGMDKTSNGDVATVYRWRLRGDEVHAADAQLLAAAPVMADALDVAEDVLSDLAKEDWVDDRVHQALAEVRAALRAAGRIP